jgi:ABC-type hemin transport system substrate-binding protein
MHNHPTVKYTPAAINKNIIALDGMQMLGFGPRTIETALYLSKKFQMIENN